MNLFSAVMISYLIGSIPMGYLVSRLQGMDIRKSGSGNIGATNVWRSLGTKAGIIVLAADILKGMLAVLLGRYMIGGGAEVLTGLAAIIGHSWPLFLGFRGGKIIATSLGVFILLDPPSTALSFLLWLLVVAFSRYISFGSVLAMVALPVLMLIMARPWEYIVFSIITAAIAIYKHLPNIRRLLDGTEPKIGR